MSPTNSTRQFSAEKAKEIVLKTAAQNDLISFSQILDARYTPNWHHEVIAQKLEAARQRVEQGKNARLILELPPRHGKSEEATIKFPAQTLGIHPEWPMIVASYSAELAEDFGLKTRDTLNHEHYQAIFNTKLRQDTQARGRWLTEQGGGYTATGVGGAITGRGFKIGIIDDPFKNREEADSEVIREKVWNWYTSTFYTRQEGVSAIIVICTRWHLDDLVGRLLRQQEELKAANLPCDEWERVRFPAIAEYDEEYRKKGDPLWPQKFNPEALEKIKNAIGIYDWSSLYQQNPISSEYQEFKESYFKQRSWQEIERLKTRRFITIDTAVSKAAAADFTGIVRNFVDKENNWNLKAYRMKIDPRELIETIFTLYHQDKPEKIGIEKTIYLQALKPFLDEEQRKRNTFLPIIELDHNQTHKETRIRGLLPRYQSGSVFHITGECKDLAEELLTFPKAIHDDVMDSLAYQLQIAEPPDPESPMPDYEEPNDDVYD
jgi:hypothetical protein